MVSAEELFYSNDALQVNVMKKAEYTRIRVSKELHAILKREARSMSIANYITELFTGIHSIGALISNDAAVNIDVVS